MGSIYSITNIINNKIYIGQTMNKYPSSRWSAHKWAARNGVKKPIYSAIRKYGEKNFVFKILEDNINIDELDKKEREYIFLNDCKLPLGYNISPGGGVLRGKDNPAFGKVPWNKGIPRTEETRQKISLANTGNTGLFGNKNPMFGKKAWNNGLSPTKESLHKNLVAQPGRKEILMKTEDRLVKKFLSLGQAAKWIRENTKYIKADYATIRKSITNNWNCYNYKFSFLEGN